MDIGLICGNADAVSFLCLHPPDSVGKVLMFWGCPSAMFVRAFIHLLVLPDRSCYHDISRMAWAILIKLTGNSHFPLLMTWGPIYKKVLGKILSLS